MKHPQPELDAKIAEAIGMTYCRKGLISYKRAAHPEDRAMGFHEWECSKKWSASSSYEDAWWALQEFLRTRPRLTFAFEQTGEIVQARLVVHGRRDGVPWEKAGTPEMAICFAILKYTERPGAI